MKFDLEIAIIRTSAIGDVILATSTLDFLSKVSVFTRKKIKVNWIGRHPSTSLIQNSYDNINIIHLENGSRTKEIINQIEHCDFILDLQVNLRSRIITRLFKSQTGKPTYSINKFRWHRSKMILKSYFRGRRKKPKKQEFIPVIKQYEINTSQLARALDAESVVDFNLQQFQLSSKPKLKVINGKNDASILSQLAKGNWIGVSAGASNTTKKAPESVIISILHQLESLTPNQRVPNLVFLGDKNDTGITSKIVENLSWPANVIDLTGKTTLLQVLEILSKVKLLLSNDSSMPHMAESLGIDCAVLFGPTSEAFGFSTQRQGSMTFSALLGCRPCSKHGKPSCRFGDKLCFYSIDIAMVARYIFDKLHEEPIIIEDT